MPFFALSFQRLLCQSWQSWKCSDIHSERIHNWLHCFLFSTEKAAFPVTTWKINGKAISLMGPSFTLSHQETHTKACTCILAKMPQDARDHFLQDQWKSKDLQCRTLSSLTTLPSCTRIKWTQEVLVFQLRNYLSNVWKCLKGLKQALTVRESRFQPRQCSHRYSLLVTSDKSKESLRTLWVQMIFNLENLQMWNPVHQSSHHDAGDSPKWNLRLLSPHLHSFLILYGSSKCIWRCTGIFLQMV